MDAELRIESDEALRLASDLATLTGQDVTSAVVQALREKLDRERTERDLEERLRRLREITAKFRRYMGEPENTSDHSWLYDENGMPR